MRYVFFVSDRTCITTENLGGALLTQFDKVEFNKETIPFVDSENKANNLINQIYDCYCQTKTKPLVLTTIVSPTIRDKFKLDFVVHIDFFQSFIPHLENELGHKATHVIGKSHGIMDEGKYYKRIDAIEFSLTNDDGVSLKNFEEAEVILVGVSRVGKTPTCLYLAVNYGIKAANYPLVDEDLTSRMLPKELIKHESKLFGLTIEPQRLNHIRSNRLPNTKYANLDNCIYELERAQQIMENYNIPCLNASNKSIEEIAASIMQKVHLHKQF